MPKGRGFTPLFDKAEFFNLYGLYGNLTPSKDKRGQIVLAVKTADPETLVTTKWRIIVDEIVCDGAHGRATDKWHFHIYKCPMGYLKAISAALPSENGDWLFLVDFVLYAQEEFCSEHPPPVCSLVSSVATAL